MGGAEQSLAAMLDISWNTNWSELPEDADVGGSAESFKRIKRAREAMLR